MKDILGIGIIGCGEIAVIHAKAIEKAKNAEIRMVMDVNEDVARDLGQKYAVPYSTHLEELLSREDIDAVYIATPHYLHSPLAIKAAQAGKHIMVEKPLAIDLEEADKMISECKKQKVALSVCLVMRYLPSVIKAKELVRKGVIGKVVGIRISSLGEKPLSYWKQGYSGRVKTDWRSSKKKSGGGVLIMNITHDIDMLRYITGLEVTQVFSQYDTFITPVEVEDMIMVILRYSNSALGVIEASSFIKERESDADEIFGSEGRITLTNPPLVYTTKNIANFKGGEWKKLEEPTSSYDPRAKYIEEFAQAVLSGQDPPIKGEDGRVALEIVLAAYKSGKENKAVSFPL